ncbi:hypothetical protein [Cellvibrio sp. QJXJ]|uniref:hypothetical protein n=1 Tax=Cellvibrio sp. QJXJ TaxID=2964606 RepID=UPI0021C3FC94|nr:hypothetical protein [Cellvibrio sp. QJXJ]UUA75129.1 hypothetical protein NNX04_21985 [Cellvibrio sp. QJXJ]
MSAITAFMISTYSYANGTNVPASVKCPGLVEAATKKAVAQRAVGNKAAEQISAGEPLKNKTCLSDIQSFDFNFFSGIPSLTGEALKRAKEEAIEALRSLACEAGSQAIEAGNKLLTCNAALGISVDGSAGFESLNVQECGGLDLEADIDAGSHNVGEGDQVGGSVDTGASGGTRNQTQSNTGGTGDKAWSDWFNQ